MFVLPRRLVLLLVGCASACVNLQASRLAVREDPASQTLSVFREGETKPILTQSVGADHRPYLHPIVAPDGKGVITEFSPAHHKHQTGIYWGITRLNDRDYFHNPAGGYWRRVSATVVAAAGDEVRWSTVYDLLGADGRPVLRETQLWAMRDQNGRYYLDLEWTGAAQTDVTVAEFDYGGLFVRMPWRQGMDAAVINSNRQRDARANGQRAVWLDVGLKVDGRDDQVHLAIFDHPLNNGYPLPWRVDNQFGVGPSRATLGSWSLPAGRSTVYRHQFMVYTGAFSDVAVDAAWREYTGERLDSALWLLAREEGKKAVFLTGEQAIEKMTVPRGFEVKLFASEPQIAQPMAFCWDDRGRLWVAENFDYETRRSGFSAAGNSRIVILEDVDGDGKMDTRKVFLEGIAFPAAIAVGFDGLWLGAPPNLLFVPDRNHDDRGDDGIEVRLTGWGIQDRHETLNSLNWGPDGWLYGCQGFATRSEVGKPADGGRVFRRGDPFPAKIAVQNPVYIDGGVWRYHPTKDRFEVVAHGFSNPWGLDFDDHGQMFISACVIPHLWHVIPGGIYHRQGGRHINPHVYADIRTIADHRHRSAHGGARIYLADEFPKEHRNRIFMANIHEHALLSDVLEPKGSGFVGHHGDDALLANDAQWVGFSVEIGPDGAIYILDWHDADICGNATNHKDTGRIFRFAPQGLAGKPGLNLAALGDLELVDLQQHQNDWYVRRARVLLQQRAAAGSLAPEVATRLWQQFTQGATAAKKLRALWALHVTRNLPSEKLLPLLDHPEPYVRGWAIQLLGEDLSTDAAMLRKFAELAERDSSPVVRLYLAAALQRLPLEARWPIARALIRHGNDATDHNIPLMLWFAIEPLVMSDTGRALALAAEGEIPLLTQFIARRATAGKQTAPLAATLAQPLRAGTQVSLLEGLRDGLNSLGRREVGPPPNWDATLTALASHADARVRELLTQIGQLFGDARATTAQLALLADVTAPVTRRREVLLGFARDAYAPALPAILKLLDHADLRRDAIRALAAFDDPRVAPALLQRYATWNPGDKAEAVMALAARRNTADVLFARLKSGVLPKTEISAFAARQLQRVIGPAFVDFWGPVTQLADDKQSEMAKFKRLLTDETLARANVANGRALFERTCSPCHTLYGQGGNIGPDLTGSNRANLDYILTEIINPSEVMQDGYRLTTVSTRDGRTLAGNVASEDEQQVTLRLVGQDSVIAKADILSREQSPTSMMPEGLLKQFSNDEVRDLIAYLRTEVPAGAR